VNGWMDGYPFIYLHVRDTGILTIELYTVCHVGAIHGRLQKIFHWQNLSPYYPNLPADSLGPITFPLLTSPPYDKTRTSDCRANIIFLCAFCAFPFYDDDL